MVARQYLVSVTMWLCILLAGGLSAIPAAAYKPEGEMRWALYVTISPAWLDPARSGGVGPQLPLVLLCAA